MHIPFEKYHGTGNDFIIIDNRKLFFPQNRKESQELINSMCHRHFGIGADGLILIQDSHEAGFLMDYYNSDGLPGSFCGNGSRCAVAFAYRNDIIKDTSIRFAAADGIHHADIYPGTQKLTTVAVTINEVTPPEQIDQNSYFADTGSPHMVVFLENIDSLDLATIGPKLRHETRWNPEGTNVNFVEQLQNGKLYVRTYERGVENETLSCGSGVAASAIAASVHYGKNSKYIGICTKGGELKVMFNPPSADKPNFHRVILEGPAKLVYRGELIHKK